MLIEQEQKILEATKKILTEDKKNLFIKIWNEIKEAQAQKLKNNLSINEIVIRGCSFIASCELENQEEPKSNQIDKFMTIDNKARIMQDPQKIISYHNDKILNLNDFMKQITEIISEYKDNTKFLVIQEIMKDFSFSRTLFKKCGELLNIFFDSHCNFFQKLIELIWNIFIYLRKKLLNNSRNLLESLPMLVTVIQFILEELDEEKFPLDMTNSLSSELKLSDLILSKLSKSYDIINREKYLQMKNKLKEVITDEHDLRNIFTNYENEFKFNLKLEDSITQISSQFNKLYEKLLKVKYFDERVFLLNSKKSDCSPMKFTPFKRQKVSNSDISTQNMMKGRKIDFERPNPTQNKFNIHDGSNFSDFNINKVTFLGDSLKDVDIAKLSKVSFNLILANY